MEKILIQIVMLVSAMLFVGSQGSICFAMPEEWYASLVSGIVIVLCCLVYNRLE